MKVHHAFGAAVLLMLFAHHIYCFIWYFCLYMTLKKLLKCIMLGIVTCFCKMGWCIGLIFLHMLSYYKECIMHFLWQYFSLFVHSKYVTSAQACNVYKLWKVYLTIVAAIYCCYLHCIILLLICNSYASYAQFFFFPQFCLYKIFCRIPTIFYYACKPCMPFMRNSSAI